MKLSQIVRRAGELAHKRKISYSLAAALALNEAGCQNHRQSVGTTRVVNDIGASDRDPLITVVTRQIGAKGLYRQAVMREEARQMPLALA